MNRTRKTFFIGLILLYAITLSHAITISIAPIPYLSEQPGSRVPKTINFQERLQEELMKSFKWNFINFKLLDTAEKTPEDFLHSAEICERLDLDYLLYGYISQEKTLHEERKTSIHGEIKLFCKERNIIQTFYSSDNPDQQERLLHDLASKIEAYFLKIFKPMNPQTEQESPEEGIISFLLQIGYWPIISIDWVDYILPLYSIDMQADFIPWRPELPFRQGANYFKAKILLSFLHSTNQAGYEKIHLFSFLMGLSFGLYFDYHFRHTIGFSLSPLFLIDYLVHDRRHDETVNTVTYHFASSFDLSYQFRFTSHFSLGINNRVAFHFIHPIRIIYNPALFFEVSLNPIHGGKKNEK